MNTRFSFIVLFVVASACGRLADDSVEATDAGKDASGKDAGALDAPNVVVDANDAAADACPSGGTACGSLCVDLVTDTNNCGACGHDCDGTKCRAAKCTSVVWEWEDPISLVVDATYVYWTNRDVYPQYGTVQRMPKKGGEVPTMIASNQAYLGALAIDAKNLYWPSGFDVVSIPLGGGSPAKVGTATNDLLSIVVDGTNVYWASAYASGDVGTMSIADGTTTVVAANRYGPGVSAADAKYFYWSEYGAVMRAPIAGGAFDKLATVSITTKIAVDATHLYWIDPGTANNQYKDGAIYQADLDGQGATALVSNLDALSTTSLTVDASHVYFSYYGSSKANYADGYVARVPIGGGTIEQIATNQTYCYGVVLDATHVYWIDNYANYPGEIHKLAK